MSYSKLVSYVRISPNSTNPRYRSVKKIVIHHMAGNLSVETCGNVFAPTSRQASSNYGIGSDGRIACYVHEENRAWTTGNQIDHDAITIEVADDVIGGSWHSSEAAMQSLVKLCADICSRYGFKASYTGNGNGTLLMHKWYQATDCPGAYLESQFPWIAEQVNKLLEGGSYTPPSNTVVSNSKIILSVDGSFGPDTVRRTQQYFGTVMDGIVSNQPMSNKKYLYSAYSGSWEFKNSGYGDGSNVARAMQKLFGCTQDGWFGQDSVRHMQKFLGVTQDGSMGPATTKAWQTWLNNH